MKKEDMPIRLELWESTLDDAKSLYNFAKNEKVGFMAGWKPHESVNESLKIIQNVFLPVKAYKIILKEEELVVGNIGAEPKGDRIAEIGYAIDQNYWGIGYMPIAVKMMLEICFDEYKLDKVLIQTDVNNLQSQRVIEKCKFTFLADTKENEPTYDGRMRTVKKYEMSFEQWKKLVNNN